MATDYLDANKEPLVQGGVYILGDMFYVLSQPLPSEPNQPIRAIDDNGAIQEIQVSAVSHMYRLDTLEMRVSMNVLRTKADFLERQLLLAKIPAKCISEEDVTRAATEQSRKNLLELGGKVGW